MSDALWYDNHTLPKRFDLCRLSSRERGLIQDGLAALLAALPQGHTLRTEVADLITALKGDS
jgi:hypothetical protein